MDSPGPVPARGRSTLAAIHARIRKYNSDVAVGSDTHRAAVLLLAGAEYGQNIDQLARRIGIDRSFVAKAARRLIDNGVWQAGRTVAEWGAHDEATVAFWNDVAVAEGKLCRRTAADGSIEWAPAGYWNKSYQFVDPGAQSKLSAVYHNPGDRPSEPVPLAAERAGDQNLTSAVEPGSPPASTTTDPAASAASESAPGSPAPADSTSPDSGSGTEGGHEDDEQKPPPPSLMEIFSDAVWIR
jgi:hypothetical protein